MNYQSLGESFDYVLEKRIRHALETAEEYGSIDGAHHKQWVIDQMVRCLTGNIVGYEEWVRKYENGPSGPETHEWDIGIAP